MKTFRLKEGDYQMDSMNRVELARDEATIAERIRNRLAIRYGSFVYDPTLGSRLHSLHREKPSERQALAKSYCEEALRPEVLTGAILRVEDVKVAYLEEKTMSVSVKCILPSGSPIDTEVRLLR